VNIRPTSSLWLHLIALLTILWITPTTHASKDFYKWQDENGVTHYSAHPPSKKQTQKEPTKVRATNLDYDAPPQASNDANPKDKEKTKAGTPPITQEKSSELCEVAKNNLKMIEENARIRVKDGDKGEYRYLTTEEIQSRKADAQKQVDENC
jgi:Domain of unknown function (DUF4124)